MAGEGRQETRFLNVDLELRTRGDLSPLLAALTRVTITLRHSVDDGRQVVWLELAGDPTGADAAIIHFVSLVRGLSDGARKAWDTCEDRCFNIGIQGGRTPHAAAFPVSADAVAGIAEVRARIEITVYGVDDEAGGDPRRRPSHKLTS